MVLPPWDRVFYFKESFRGKSMVIRPQPTAQRYMWPYMVTLNLMVLEYPVLRQKILMMSYLDLARPLLGKI